MDTLNTTDLDIVLLYLDAALTDRDLDADSHVAYCLTHARALLIATAPQLARLERFADELVDNARIDANLTAQGCNPCPME